MYPPHTHCLEKHVVLKCDAHTSESPVCNFCYPHLANTDIVVSHGRMQKVSSENVLEMKLLEPAIDVIRRVSLKRAV